MKAAATAKAAAMAKVAATAKATATANDDSGESTIEPWLTGLIVETLLLSRSIQYRVFFCIVRATSLLLM